MTPSSPSADAPRTVTILGCTGSVGTQTIDLLLAEPDRYRVKALVAGSKIELRARGSEPGH